MFHGVMGEPHKRGVVASFHERGDVWPEPSGTVFDGSDQPAGMSGLLAGTAIATENGWRAAEMIVPGDHVLTFDYGLLPVRDVRIAVAPPEGAWHRADRLVLEVPRGALDNHWPFRVLGAQTVMVESDLAEALTGDPFLLMTARRLIGYRGITPVAAAPSDMLVTLMFDDDQIVHVSGSALMLCPAAPEARGTAGTTLYPRMSPEREEQVAIWLRRGEGCGTHAALERGAIRAIAPEARSMVM